MFKGGQAAGQPYHPLSSPQLVIRSPFQLTRTGLIRFLAASCSVCPWERASLTFCFLICEQGITSLCLEVGYKPVSSVNSTCCQVLLCWPQVPAPSVSHTWPRANSGEGVRDLGTSVFCKKLPSSNGS